MVSADTINTYRLDKFWSDQEVLYDYNTDLHGIGNRSVTVVLCNKYLWFYVYFSDTEAFQACFRLLHADDDDDDDDALRDWIVVMRSLGGPVAY